MNGPAGSADGTGPAAKSSRRVFSPPHVARRAALQRILENGLLWAIGNALTSGPLVAYFWQELGAAGWDVGLLLAAPALVGSLRLSTPWVVTRVGDTRRATISLYLAAYAVLALVPLVCLAMPAQRAAPLALLVAIVSFHQLLESMAAAASWPWFGEFVPPRLRGRFFARRQVWQLAGQIPTLLLSGHLADAWKANHARHATLGYVILLSVGTGFLWLSIWPLVRLARSGSPRETTRKVVATLPASRTTAGISALAARGAVGVALSDRRFWPLLAFGCWVAWFNGITQSAQNIFPRAVLRLDLLPISAMRTLMLVGQMLLGPVLGRWSDRRGTRRVMIASQLVVATAPVFFMLATRGAPYWIAGAYLAWAAYVGLNVCLPNTMLLLSGGRDRGAYVATYFGLSTAVYAVATLAGGAWFDRAKSGVAFWGTTLDRYLVLFGVALVARLLAVGWLVLLPKGIARREGPLATHE